MIALIDDSHIIAAPYFESAASTNDEPETQPENTQETKPKARIAAEILANGYLLQDHIVAKGLEYDTKYNLSTRLTGYLQTLQSNGKLLLHLDRNNMCGGVAVALFKYYGVVNLMLQRQQTINSEDI